MKTSPLPTQESSEKKAITFLLPTINRIMALMSTGEMTSLITQLNGATDPNKPYSLSFHFKSDCFKSACGLITSASTAPRNPFLLALYFFSMHPQIDLGTGVLDDADKEELLELLRRYESFINDSTYETAWDAFAGFIVAENPPDAQEIIKQFNNSHLARNLVIPNIKLAGVITNNDVMDIGKFVTNVAKENAKKRIDVTCILTDESDSVKLTGRQRFTEYDRNVYNAVSSLYVYGDESHIMTPAMIYRMMTGMTDAENLSNDQIKSVTGSLDKMRFIRARIDCTAELQARGITLNSQQINNGEIDTYLLTAEAVNVRAGGQIVKAYQIIKVPVLYEYASAVGQVLTVPTTVLDIKIISKGEITTRRLPNTESRILIRGYLIRRIEGMKGKNNLTSRCIALYDYEKKGETHHGLYSIAGNPNPRRTEAKRIRDDAEKMLDYWKASCYIHDYKALTTGNKITSYEIILPKKALPAQNHAESEKATEDESKKESK